MGRLPQSVQELLAATNMVCPIRYWAMRNPARRAVMDAGRTWTYAEIDSAITGATGILAARRQDTLPVALYRAGAVQTIIWLFASMRLGTTAFLLGDRVPSEVIDRLGAQSAFGPLVSREPIRHSARVVDPDLPLAAMPGARAPGVSGSGEDPAEAGPGRQVADDDTDRAAGAMLSIEHPATYLYTSGTSGAPQVAVHAIRSHVASALMSNDRIRLSTESVWLLSLPLAHVSGLGILFRSVLAGATIAVQEESQSLAMAVQAYGVTHLSVVTTQLLRLVAELGRAPAHLETVLVGGGPVESDVIRKAVRAGFPVRTTYGMTEFSSQITTSDVWRTEEERYSSGWPLPGVDVTLADDGEILVRGPSRFIGYLSDRGRVDSEPLDAWFPTSDLGQMVDGELYPLGRKDEMFISGGENIHPEEIERELLACEGVEAAIVVPVPDPVFGYRPIAAVRWEEAAATAKRAAAKEVANALLDRLRQRLPGFKIPLAVLPWPDLKAPSGLKVDRAAVRNAVLAAWQAEAEGR